MKKYLDVKMVRKFDNELDGEFKFVHNATFKYEFNVPVQELIDNGEIEEILFVLNSMFLDEIPVDNEDEVLEEYVVEVEEYDEYEIPKMIKFETDIYQVDVELDSELIKEHLMKKGYKMFETTIYVETINATTKKVLAKDDDHVSSIIYGKTGDRILEILDDPDMKLKQVHYEHGIQDITEIK